MTDTLPRLDKQAVHQRLDEICAALDLVTAAASGAFELVENGLGIPHSGRKMRDLSCVLVVEVLAERAKTMVVDLLENPPVIADQPDDCTDDGR